MVVVPIADVGVWSVGVPSFPPVPDAVLRGLLYRLIARNNNNPSRSRVICVSLDKPSGFFLIVFFHVARKPLKCSSAQISDYTRSARRRRRHEIFYRSNVTVAVAASILSSGSDEVAPRQVSTPPQPPPSSSSVFTAVAFFPERWPAGREDVTTTAGFTTSIHVSSRIFLSPRCGGEAVFLPHVFRVFPSRGRAELVGNERGRLCDVSSPFEFWPGHLDSRGFVLSRLALSPHHHRLLPSRLGRNWRPTFITPRANSFPLLWMSSDCCDCVLTNVIRMFRPQTNKKK